MASLKQLLRNLIQGVRLQSVAQSYLSGLGQAAARNLRPPALSSFTSSPGVVTPTMGLARQQAFRSASQAESDAKLSGLRAAFMLQSGGQQTTEREVRARLAKQEADEMRSRIEDSVRFRIEQEKLVKKYGTIGAATISFGTGLKQAGSAIGDTARGLQGSFLRLAAAASPSAFATFAGSLELLAAKIGRGLLPIIDRLSGFVQGLGRTVDRVEKSTGLNVGATLFGAYAGYRLAGRLAGTGAAASGLASAAGGFLRTGGLVVGGSLLANVEANRQTRTSGALQGLAGGAATGAAIGSFVPAIGTAVGAAVGAAIGGLRGYFKGKSDEEEKDDDLKRSNRLPVRSRFESFASFGESLQVAGLQGDQLQAELLKEQLQNLRGSNQLLVRIESNTSRVRDFVPAWRA